MTTPTTQPRYNGGTVMLYEIVGSEWKEVARCEGELSAEDIARRLNERSELRDMLERVLARRDEADSIDFPSASKVELYECAITEARALLARIQK